MLDYHHRPWAPSGRYQPSRKEQMDPIGPVDTTPRPCHTCLLGKSGHFVPDELILLTIAPSLYDYRIVVVHANPSYACFAIGQRERMLGLLYQDGHYILTLLPTFFGKIYFCVQCVSPYNDTGPTDPESSLRLPHSQEYSLKTTRVQNFCIHDNSRVQKFCTFLGVKQP